MFAAFGYPRPTLMTTIYDMVYDILPVFLYDYIHTS